MVIVNDRPDKTSVFLLGGMNMMQDVSLQNKSQQVEAVYDT